MIYWLIIGENGSPATDTATVATLLQVNITFQII